LEKIPKPTEEDIELRTNSDDWKRQKKCFKFVFPITIWICFIYFLDLSEISEITSPVNYGINWVIRRYISLF
jgi:hypothetical protein